MKIRWLIGVVMLVVFVVAAIVFPYRPLLFNTATIVSAKWIAGELVVTSEYNVGILSCSTRYQCTHTIDNTIRSAAPAKQKWQVGEELIEIAYNQYSPSTCAYSGRLYVASTVYNCAVAMTTSLVLSILIGHQIVKRWYLWSLRSQSQSPH